MVRKQSFLKRAEVEERAAAVVVNHMALAETSVRLESSKVWEHFRINELKKCVNAKYAKST